MVERLVERRSVHRDAMSVGKKRLQRIKKTAWHRFSIGGKGRYALSESSEREKGRCIGSRGKSTEYGRDSARHCNTTNDKQA